MTRASMLPGALVALRSEEFGKDFPGYRGMPDIGPFATFGMFTLLQTPSAMAMLP